MSNENSKRQNIPTRRPRWLPKIVAIGGVLALVWLLGDKFFGVDGAMLSPNISEAAMPVENPQIFVVPVVEMNMNLAVSGKLEPGKVTPIIAPFDGIILERFVPLGSYVEKGASLVTMDTAELESRLREAKSAWVRAKIAADTLANWENGPDMLRARRVHIASVSTMETLSRKIADTKKLLDRGIVARDEYDDMVQQYEEQKRTVANALLDLEETRKRGNATQQELLALDLENARTRLDDLETQRNGAKVLATMSGILIRPPGDASGTASTPVASVIEPGARLARGTPLFMIADTSSFIVKAHIDEIDVNHTRVGQKAEINSDAFPGVKVEGKVVSVSAEASSSEMGPAPRFDVRIHFDVADETLRKQIRIGMSARATILIHNNPKALIIPPRAVFRRGNALHVVVRDAVTGQSHSVSVTTGMTNEQGVEILSGIAESDQIVLDTAALSDVR